MRATPSWYEAERVVERLGAELETTTRTLIGQGMMFRWIDPITPAGPDWESELAELERRTGPLPPAIACWYSRFEMVDLSGWVEDWCAVPPRSATPGLGAGLSRFLGDPLTIRSPGELALLIDEGFEAHRGGRVWLPISGDRRQKERSGSGALLMSWRPHSFDATIEDGQGRTFLNYVEHALSWLGYPGWADYEEIPAIVRAQRSRIMRPETHG
ncbi:MAG: hypothetical protein U1E65_18780 [Myxococcota bacterium]